MTRVGVKSLKNNLSAYLRRVRRGDLILVTDRDNVIAEIHPVRPTARRAGSLNAKLRQLAERGEAELATRKPGRLRLDALPGGRLPLTSRQILDDLRNEAR